MDQIPKHQESLGTYIPVTHDGEQYVTMNSVVTNGGALHNSIELDSSQPQIWRKDSSGQNNEGSTTMDIRGAGVAARMQDVDEILLGKLDERLPLIGEVNQT